MTSKQKTVCIVGAGESGIAALKESVKHGLLPTCYDLDSDIGGVWHAKPPGHQSNTASVWPSLVTNNSKFNVCFSDFAPLPSHPVFLSPKQMCEYFKKVIDHFDLEKYIQLNTQVVKIRETVDHAETGQWEVYTKPSGGEYLTLNTENSLDGCRKEIFDNVMVCSGWFKKPFYPDIPGMDTFTGSLTHSFTYADPRPFDGKKVLVVGNKFSAAEIVSDVANLAKETYLALGSGTWIVPRMFQGARPFDASIPRSIIYSRDPDYEFNELVFQHSQYKMDHSTSGVGCVVPPSESRICISDDLPLKLACGKIKPYSHLKELTETTAVFKEGGSIQDLDAVIFCTGYRTDISFLDVEVRNSEGRLSTYLFVFPLGRRHQTLAIIGHYGTDGPMVVMGENQARVAAMVMTGAHKLPSQDVMACSVKTWSKVSWMDRQGTCNYNVPGFVLMDALAVEGGFYPSFLKVALRDPLLAWRNWTGPYMAAQFRLLGPGSEWARAREVCYMGFREGMSCVRHGPVKVVVRTDVSRRRRRRAVVVVGMLVALVGVVGLVRKGSDGFGERCWGLIRS